MLKWYRKVPGTMKIWFPSSVTRKLSSEPFPVLEDTLDGVHLTTAQEKSEILINQLEQINKLCRAGGGEKGQAVHVKKNKKILPREKLNLIFDEDSDTLELGLQSGLSQDYGDIPGASAITIIGKIHDHYCMASVNDGTLKGGTFFPISLKKTLRAQDISHQNHLPMINLVDSGGAFLPLQSEIFPDKLHGGRGFYNQAVYGADGVPQFALICGSCTAGGAYIPSMCEDAGIVHKIGTMFLAGPPLVKAALGEEISAENLGGATVHCAESGGTDYFAHTEQEGFTILRDAVATVSNGSGQFAYVHQPPIYDSNELNVACGLNNIDKSHTLGIISRIVDGSRFREFKPLYGRNLVVGYSKINGCCVGVLANCGPITYEDGLKGAHFIQICEHRQLPLIFLQNSGSLGEFSTHLEDLSSEERSLTLRGRASMIASVSCATVSKVVINVGGCHGDDNYCMCGPSFEPNFIFSWPGTEVSHAFNSHVSPILELEEANKKPSKSAFDFSPHSSWFFAARSLYDGIILPADTRKVIVQCLKIFEQKKRVNYQRKTFPVYRF